MANIYNRKSNTLLSGTSGADSIYNDWCDLVTIASGAGSDSIYNYLGDSVSIDAGTDSDYIHNRAGYSVTIDSGAGDDSIESSGTDNKLIGGTGNDYIESWSGKNVTINAGTGNDLISLSANYSEQNVILYIEGDGNDTIYGFNDDDTLQIWDNTYSTMKNGDDVIITVDDGKITLVGAASLSGFQETETDSWTLDGTTATYGSLVVTGVTSLDGLKVSGKTVTVSAASLGTEKISVSDGYKLALGDDVKAPTTKKSWSLKNSTATYKQTTAAGYTLENNSIVYSKKSSKTLATVTGVNDKSGLKVSGKTIKLSGDSLSKKISVSGAYTFDFANDFKNASITGSSSNDTIIARGKNIFVTGGKGADIFQFKSAGTIGDYEKADKISLTSAANISVSGSDVIFNKKITVAGAADKVVTYIEGGVEKIFKPATDNVKYNAAGTAATLLATYEEDTFAANSTLATIKTSAVNYGLSIIGNKRANKITGTSEDDYIDGQGSNDTLVGGAGNDSLVGGKGNDSLWGGAGDDTLLGGGGKDIFVYRDGDGDDLISGYESIDIIKVFSDNEVNAPTTDTAGNVTFKIGGGQLTFENAADKYIELFIGDSNNTYDKKYRPAGK